jgi:hypothetical protein
MIDQIKLYEDQVNSMTMQNFNSSGDMIKSSGSIVEDYDNSSGSFGKGKNQVNYSTSTYYSKR